MLNKNRKNTISANSIKNTNKFYENLVKWALTSFYEWWMNIMQCVFHHAQFCYPKNNLKKKKRWLPFTHRDLYECF